MHLSFKELKGVTRLFSDYLYSFANLAEFFNGDYRELSSFQNILEQIKAKDYPRKLLVQILADQNQKFGASPRTLANIEALKDESCYVVFTGQQIGLLGGPLYTLYKSLTAIKLSEKLSGQLGIKVVPIFWMATDDHDFAEINHIFFVDRQNSLVKLEYQPEKDWQGWPSAQIILDQNICRTFEILSSSCREAGYTKPVLEKLSQFYSAGQPYYLAFARWMNHILGQYGLIFLNPADPQFKALLRPIFSAELEKNGSLQLLIEKTSQNLETLKYHRQVHKKVGLTNLFYHSPRRLHITKQNGRFGWEGASPEFGGSELVKLIESSPQNYSANVLLRPLLESFAFPNLAHVAGPSEIAYFAQIRSLHTELGVEMPVIYPRQSFTLLEPETRQILTEYQISPPEIMQDVEQVYTRIIEKKIPAGAEKLLNQTQAELKRKVEELSEKILMIQPTLKPNLEFTQAKIDFEFNKFKEKFFQSYKKQFKQIKEELYLVQDLLHPQNTFQERIFSPIHFLSRYGFEFTDFLYQKIDLENFDHQVLELSER